MLVAILPLLDSPLARYLLKSWESRGCGPRLTRVRRTVLVSFPRGYRHEQDLSVGCGAVVGGGRCHGDEFAIRVRAAFQDQRRLEPKRQRQRKTRTTTTTRIARRTTTETTTIKTIRATKAVKTTKAATQASAEKSGAVAVPAAIQEPAKSEQPRAEQPRSVGNQGQFGNQGQNFKAKAARTDRRQQQDWSSGPAVPKASPAMTTITTAITKK